MGLAALTNRIYQAVSWRAPYRLRAALEDPAAAQQALLRNMLIDNASSAYGSAHDFVNIDTHEQWCARVPLVDYDDIAPQIERIAAGENGVLTAQPVRFLEPTSGSTGGGKLIPYTDGLRAQFSATTTPWIADIMRSYPGARAGRAYWSVSPPARSERTTAGGVAIGVPSDTDYFGPIVAALLARIMAVPSALSSVTDMHACRYVTLRALLAADDLSFISVWHPSFLTLLAGALDDNWAALLDDMQSGQLSVDLPDDSAGVLTAALPPRPARAAALRDAFGDQAPRDLRAIWPRLALVSCWTDAHAARALPEMRERVPGVTVQPKGLFLTEGPVSLPLRAAEHPVLAVGSCYLEFLPVADDAIEREVDPHTPTLRAHELEPGMLAEAVLTTAGGLYRYRTHDLVRVHGRHLATPTVEFVGRGNRTSDLVGEKLTEPVVEQALAAAARAASVTASFAQITPDLNQSPPRYVLLVDCAPADADEFARAVEAELAKQYHYGVARDLGQLAPVQPRTIPDGQRRYEHAAASVGRRIGTLKTPALEVDPSWISRFR